MDNNLYKQFKNNQFSKLDLHGLTVDLAHQKLIQYFKTNYLKKNLFHIIVTGLGNKAEGGEFFTGKIRKQFSVLVRYRKVSIYGKVLFTL